MRAGINILSVVVLCTLFSQSADAQSLSKYRQKLEFGSSNSARVTIREDDSARMALSEIESTHKGGNSINGYRVGVFFDNGATARAKAQKVVEECKELFGDIPTTMTYDNPYFKVCVGYCINSEEAIMMLNRVQKHFPKAYLMREKISPADIEKAHNMSLSTPQSGAAKDATSEI